MLKKICSISSESIYKRNGRLNPEEKHVFFHPELIYSTLFFSLSLPDPQRLPHLAREEEISKWELQEGEKSKGEKALLFIFKEFPKLI